MSGVLAKRRPEKDGKLGKFIEPSTPAALMSFTRSSICHVPTRISSKAVGSTPNSLRGLPATALSPMFGMTVSL